MEANEYLISAEQIRSCVASVSEMLVRSQLALCVNQVLSDLISRDAVANQYDHVYLHPNDYQLDDARQKILQCIEGTRSEVISSETLTGIDAAACHVFSGDVHLVDILWQQRLLGVMHESTNARFFDATSGSVANQIARGSSSVKYVWNPMLMDIVSDVRPFFDVPVWPR